MPHVRNRPQKQYSENATAIVTFWEIGTDSLAVFYSQHGDNGYENKKQAMLDECQRLQDDYGDRLPIRPNPTTILKYWKVAEVFSESKIHKLAQKISNRGSRFAPSHLMRCLAVTDPDSFQNLLMDAVKASWGAKKVEAGVRASRSRRSQVSGRRPQVSDEPAGLVVQAEQLCITWLRWFDTAKPRFEKRERSVIQKARESVLEVQMHFYELHEQRMEKERRALTIKERD
ncbi:hypothetical protein BH11PLA2_BH11PLA2_46840 [soil metagenome]